MAACTRQGVRAAGRASGVAAAALPSSLLRVATSMAARGLARLAGAPCSFAAGEGYALWLCLGPVRGCCVYRFQAL